MSSVKHRIKNETDLLTQRIRRLMQQKNKSSINVTELIEVNTSNMVVLKDSKSR